MSGFSSTCSVDRWIDNREVVKVLGNEVKHPHVWCAKAVAYRGFPVGSRIGRRKQWKLSEVLAWRAAQHEKQRNK